MGGLIPATGEINVMSPFDFNAPLLGTVATLAVGGSDIVPAVETPADLETLARFHRDKVSWFCLHVDFPESEAAVFKESRNKSLADVRMKKGVIEASFQRCCKNS